ncbi:MAG: F0F1 ATP synthase subunit B [Kiritimatiellia bacterium]|nr:F0F1 ATP synthase subunit B [Kiritimatiellia bacterium]
MLDINIYLIAGQIFTFLIGLAVLWRVAYKPIAGIFKQRADKIGRDLYAAEKARQDVERIKSDYEAQMARLADETQKMMNKAVKDAQLVRDEIVKSARDQGKEMVARAVEQIEFEKQKALKEVRQQVLEVSLLVAEKAIGETMNNDLQRRLVDQVFAQIEEKK